MRVRPFGRTAILAGALWSLLGLAVACGSGGQAEPASVAPTQEPRVESAPVLPVTVTDKDGRHVTVRDVSRIVPLNGDIAEVVWALGLGKNVVGVDTSATYPEEARKLPNIGYQRALSAEGILSLNPSVIIGNEEAGPPEVIEQIRGVGVPLVLIKNTTTIEGVGTKIRAIAAALGVPGRGAELAAATEKEIEAALELAAKAREKPRVMFLYVRGTGTQAILGEGSRGDAMIQAAGGVDVAIEAGIKGSKPVTAEAVVQAQPDVLLLLTAGFESVGGIDGLLAIPGIAQTPAGMARRVVHLDDQYLLGLGPRTGKALLDLIRALHPELA